MNRRYYLVVTSVLIRCDLIKLSLITISCRRFLSRTFSKCIYTKVNENIVLYHCIFCIIIGGVFYSRIRNNEETDRVYCRLYSMGKYSRTINSRFYSSISRRAARLRARETFVPCFTTQNVCTRAFTF